MTELQDEMLAVAAEMESVSDPIAPLIREWASILEAEQQQMGEPVAWIDMDGYAYSQKELNTCDMTVDDLNTPIIPLYTHPPADTTKGPVPGGEGCKSPGECKKQGFCMDGWHCTYIVPEWQRLKMTDAAEKPE